MRYDKESWRKKWQPTLVFLPGASHGQRSLAGYSPWGHKELDMTGQLTHKIRKYLHQREHCQFYFTNTYK